MSLPEFFGLDIGYSSAKIVQLSGVSKNEPQLVACAQTDISKPLISLKDDTEKKAFAEKLKLLREVAGIKTNKCVLSLPEATLFSKIITVPDLPEEQMEKVIFFEARNHLPISPEEVQMDHIPITTKIIDNRKVQQILLIAAPKTMINAYLDIMSMCDFEVLALETESLASTRAISRISDLVKGTLVVDFGSQGLAVSIVRGQDMVFSQSIGTGSDALTMAIARDFNLDVRQAEQYKRTYGLLSNQLEGRIARSLNPVISIIDNELNKVVNFMRINLPDFAPVQVFLTGDGALLPGLIENINQNVGLPTIVADPLTNIAISSKAKDQLQTISAPGLTVAVGLSLKTE